MLQVPGAIFCKAILSLCLLPRPTLYLEDWAGSPYSEEAITIRSKELSPRLPIVSGLQGYEEDY